LAEIACGDFGGHYSVDRGQKARLLPATPCDDSTAISADIFVDVHVQPCGDSLPSASDGGYMRAGS
jgi:hypothetical protein